MSTIQGVDNPPPEQRFFFLGGRLPFRSSCAFFLHIL